MSHVTVAPPCATRKVSSAYTKNMLLQCLYGKRHIFAGQDGSVKMDGQTLELATLRVPWDTNAILSLTANTSEFLVDLVMSEKGAPI